MDTDTAGMDKQLYQHLCGCLDNLPQKPSSIVRVFISSTFTDTICERNALLEHVYPKLQEFCNQHGLQFQPVDMRWGVREEAQNDHMTSDLCIREIEKSQRLSVGPSFVLILGQKYGYRPFPACIALTEYRAMHETLQSLGRDTAVLDKWFCEDRNVVPPVVRLQQISKHIPHYNNKEEAELRAAAQQEWQATFSQIQELLRVGVDQAVAEARVTEPARRKYFISVTEDEAQHGLLQSKDPRMQLCIQRTISNITEHLDHPRIGRFMDVLPGTNRVNTEAQNLLYMLSSRSIPRVVPEKNVLHYQVKWGKEDGISDCDHHDYLMEFCQGVEAAIKKTISKALQRRQRLNSDPLFSEVLQHLHICKSRCAVFYGRERILARISSYLEGDSQSPLVVYGESGSGKTSVMAKAASRVRKSLPGAIVLLRFLGTSVQSSSLEAVLTSLCTQLACCLNLPPGDLPDDYAKLAEYWKNMLKMVPDSRQVVVLLDSLDQLTNTRKVSQLKWLPAELTSNVKTVVSTLPSGPYRGILERLQHSVPKTNVIQVPPLGQASCFDIINAWLAKEKKTLTPQQFSLVKEAFDQCTLPLYTRLVFEEVCKWRSYTAIESLALADSVPGIIAQLFERLEVHHGKVFVSHVLSYITCAVNGLSELEIEDLLSLDDEVLNETFSFWLPPVRRIPVLLWTRMREDLESYITEREADGATVIAWYHRQFREASKKRYLANSEVRKKTHSNMADYFMGKWAKGKKKPFIYPPKLAERLRITDKNGTADRKVQEQPLYWKGQDENGKTTITYNKRKMVELPYHLVTSGRHVDLASEVIWSYRWLRSKIKAYSPHHVLYDLSLAAYAFTDNAPLKLLAGVIRRAAASLRKEPSSLASEMIGRLYNHTEESDIARFLKDCQKLGAREDCALLPVAQCFDGPIGHLLHTLEGHTKRIVDIAFTEDSQHLYSVSEDETIACWDMVHGDTVNIIDVTDLGMGRHAEILRQQDAVESDCKYIILELYQHTTDIGAYDTETGEQLYRVRSNPGEYRHNTIVTDNYILRKGYLIRKEDGLKIKPIPYLNNLTSFVEVHISQDEKILLVGQCHDVVVFNLETDKEIVRLKGESIPSCFLFVDDTVIVGYAGTCHVSFFRIEFENGNKVTKIMDFEFQKEFPNVNFMKGNRHTQEVSNITLSNSKLLVVLNLKKKHLFVTSTAGSHPTMLQWEGVEFTNNMYTDNAAFSPQDDKVIANMGPTLCIWLAATGQLISKFRFSPTEGDWYHLAVSPTNYIAATTSKQDSVIQVWDLQKLEDDPGHHQENTFQHPISLMVKDDSTHKVFIKTFVRVDAFQGYHFVDHFGIQTWDYSKNISNTSSVDTFLPFDKYGRLKLFVVGRCGPYAAIVVTVVKEEMIYIINYCTGELECKIMTSGCNKVVFAESYFVAERAGFSPDGSAEAPPTEVEVYRLDNGEVVLSTVGAYTPVVTSDRSKMVCLQKPSSLVVTDLKNGCHQTSYQLSYTYQNLHALPGNTSLVLAESVDMISSSFVTIDPSTGRELSVITRLGYATIQDISLFGSVAIDSSLSVYDLDKGKKLCHFTFQGTNPQPFIRLTYDGKYAVWADTKPVDCVRAADITKQKLVATVTTHYKVTSLEVVLGGYMVIIGCQNGKILPFMLHPDEDRESGMTHMYELSRMGLQVVVDPVQASVVEVMKEYANRKLLQTTAISLEKGKVKDKGGSHGNQGDAGKATGGSEAKGSSHMCAVL